MPFTDIDECARVNDCQQLCTDTDGSFSCGCEIGYALDPNGYTCAGNNDHCWDHFSYESLYAYNYMFMSYNILTYSVYLLATTQCSSGASCSHLCAVINGMEICSCPSGLVLQNDNITCAGRHTFKIMAP